MRCLHTTPYCALSSSVCALRHVHEALFQIVYLFWHVSALQCIMPNKLIHAFPAGKKGGGWFS